MLADDFFSYLFTLFICYLFSFTNTIEYRLASAATFFFSYNLFFCTKWKLKGKRKKLFNIFHVMLARSHSNATRTHIESLLLLIKALKFNHFPRSTNEFGCNLYRPCARRALFPNQTSSSSELYNSARQCVLLTSPTKQSSQARSFFSLFISFRLFFVVVLLCIFIYIAVNDSIVNISDVKVRTRAQSVYMPRALTLRRKKQP